MKHGNISHNSRSWALRARKVTHLWAGHLYFLAPSDTQEGVHLSRPHVHPGVNISRQEDAAASLSLSLFFVVLAALFHK